MTEKEQLKAWATLISRFSELGDVVLRLLEENDELYRRTFALSLIPAEALEVMIEASLESEDFKWN